VISDSVENISEVNFFTPLECARRSRRGLDGNECADNDSSLLDDSFERHLSSDVVVLLCSSSGSSDCVDGCDAEASAERDDCDSLAFEELCSVR
jgi:hypothetical protein